MVKNAFLLLSLLVLGACSGKGTDVGLKVSKSFAISSTNGGGAVLYLSNPDTKDNKTIVVEKEEVTVTLVNGNWDFSVVAWNGTSPFDGEISCDRKSAVLSGQKVEIDLNPSVSGCETIHFLKKELSFMNCQSLSGILPGETCDDMARGQAGSYQVRFESPGNEMLKSICIAAPSAPASLVNTGISLPFAYIKDFKFDLFSDASCSSGKKAYSHTEALKDEGTLYFSYGSMTAYAPVVTNILPPDVVANVGTIIQLAYTDLNFDQATSCEVSDLQNLVQTLPCSCTLGTCSVGVKGTLDYVGSASFNYRVLANGQYSNIAAANFYITQPDFPPVADGILDGGVHALGLLSFTLPYHDDNSDQASSCQILSQSANTSGGTCTCTSGNCIASLSADAYGLGSFDYKVTALGVESNIANVSFTLVGLPEITFVPTIGAQIGQSINYGIGLNHNGAVVTCSISPALPIGIVLDPGSCTISGATGTVLAPTTYTITATNLAGSTTADMTIQINALPPTVDYSSALVADFYIEESLIITPSINDNGATVTSCSIFPALPAGLSIDTNCVITGVASVPVNQNFTVTATNAGGSADVTFLLKIQSPFITTWQIAAANESITLPLVSGVTYNFRVDWGDGSDSIISSWDSPDKVHLYVAAGTYTVKIYGQIPQIKFYGSGVESKIRTVEQWGTSKWTSMDHAFANCSNFQITALDKPDLSEAQNLSAMFMNASNFNSDISGWNTQTITNMSYMFKNASVFNQTINGWDTSNVIDMSYMFSGALAFNQMLDLWNTQSVVNMSAMFENSNFNMPLNTWNTSSVTNMSMMFLYAASFNQPLDAWDTSNVTNFDSMFSNATSFNQDLTGWNVSSATSYVYFANAANPLWTTKPAGF